jgi:diketogulonate reductase-like aldo/keto reductase
LCSGVPHLEEIVAASLELPSVNQVELHPFCQQRPIVEWCRKHDVAIQAYSPLIRGKKWEDATLQRLAEKYGKEIPQVLIRWSLKMG